MSFADNEEKQETNQESQAETSNAPKTPEQASSVDYKDLYMRLNADMQNYKRRVEKERAEWMFIAQADILKAIFPLIDDLSRALEVTVGKTLPPEIQSWVEGLQLIQKNIQKKLQELEIVEITTTGTFNPDIHEALMHVDSPEHKTGEIVQVLSKGYTYKGKVLQYAKVGVAK